MVLDRKSKQKAEKKQTKSKQKASKKQAKSKHLYT